MPVTFDDALKDKKCPICGSPIRLTITEPPANQGYSHFAMTEEKETCTNPSCKYEDLGYPY